MEQNQIEKLTTLILARLVAPPKGGLSKKKIKNDLGKLVEHLWLGAEWESRFEEAYNILFSRNHISEDKNSVELTESGKEFILECFGFSDVPQRCQWITIKNNYLPALFLNIKPGSPEFKKKFKGVETLRAECLRQSYDLKIPPLPTLTQATHALLWKTLGVDTEKPFSIKAAVDALLAKPSGFIDYLEPKIVAEKLCSRAIGMRNSNAGELQRTFIRCFIDDKPLPFQSVSHLSRNERSSTATTQPVEFKLESLDLEIFARHVNDIAKECPTGRFGRNKVFISHVWRSFQQKYPEWQISEDEFKRMLTQANHQQFLTLSHADLVSVMNPQDVKESETPYLNIQFHFIRTGEE